MVCELTIPKRKICSAQRPLHPGPDRDHKGAGPAHRGHRQRYRSVQQSICGFQDGKGHRRAKKKPASEAIQKATAEATRVPYETMEICLKGLDITAGDSRQIKSQRSFRSGRCSPQSAGRLKRGIFECDDKPAGDQRRKIREEFDNAAGMVKEAEARRPIFIQRSWRPFRAAAAI